MKRIVLFVATNLAVLLLLTVVTRLLGVDHWLTARGMNYSMLLAFSAVIGFSGSFISLAISKWMAKVTHQIHVIHSPQSQGEVWLVEKVREQAGKAGIAMPEVGIYESPEANAFATGPSRNNALVAVSTGLLQQMRPREVEGVLAHEVSHVANGDMVTMTLLQGTLNTFVVFLSRVLGFALDQALRRSDDDNRRGPGMGFFLGSMICQVVLGLLASLIVMAYSRRREFRADAMGAQLEGRDAMLGGLRRLKQITESGGVIDDRSAALSAFKINHPTGVMRLLMSHPPLEERIAALQKAE
jgi:heat shock protein HtpX